MEDFYSIKDSDVFENPDTEPQEYSDRPTAKGIVLDEHDRVAILFANGHGLFPGGGIEEGETPEGAFRRECMEEIGCEIEILSKLGITTDLRARDQRKYITYFFVAKVIGEKGLPTTMEEGELACELKWLPSDEIKDMLGEQIEALKNKEGYYHTRFNARTHRAAFEKYLEMKK